MYRDTDQGVRYLVKEGDARVVSDRATTHAKAMAIGVLVDPSFAFPLPIFGINYLEFRGRAAAPIRSLRCCSAACSPPATCSGRRIGGTPLDASVDFFGIAVPASDRLHSRPTANALTSAS